MSYVKHRIEEIRQIFEEELGGVPFMYSIYYAYEDTDPDELTTEVGMNCRPIFAEGFVRNDAEVNKYFEHEPPENYEMILDAPLSDLVTEELSDIIDGALKKIQDIIFRSDDVGLVSGICVTIYYLDDPSRPDVYSGKRQVYALDVDDLLKNYDQFFETVMVLMRDFGMDYLEDLVCSYDRYEFLV